MPFQSSEWGVYGLFGVWGPVTFVATSSGVAPVTVTSRRLITVTGNLLLTNVSRS